MRFLRTPPPSERRPATSGRGFTLIELMIVITIIAILLSIAIPSYKHSITRAREAVLKENLYILRTSIQQFTVDKERPPGSLDELVGEGYIHAVPPDITGTPDTWQLEYADMLISPEQMNTGISGVHSGSEGISSEGTPYSTW
ncbi:MAG: type II secretion system protein [Candidatus Acidiferrales bacterium]